MIKVAVSVLGLVLMLSPGARSQEVLVRTAQLDSIHLAEHSPIKSVQSGQLKIDLQTKQVEIVIQPAMPECPRYQVCVQMMPEPVQIVLPLTKVVTNSCGTLYQAERDGVSVDGKTELVDVVDGTAALASCSRLQSAKIVASHVVIQRDLNGDERQAEVSIFMSNQWSD